MTILWVMPNWRAPSEVWMQRMLRMVSGHLAGVCAHDPAPTWDDGSPGFALHLPNRSPIDAALRLATGGRWRGPNAAVRDAVARTRPTAIVVHYLTLARELEGVLAKVRLPVVVHAHGFDLSWDLRRDDRPSRRFHDRGYVEAVRRIAGFARILVNSPFSRQQLLDVGISPDRIDLKPIGVPVPPSPPQREAGQRLRILFLGRLVDFKGPDLVIRAFDLAVRRGLDAELLVAGDGAMRGECEDLARRSPCAPHVRFLGTVSEEEGDELRRRCDVFTAHNQVGPRSRQVETLGVSILEAMAAGMPVVTGRSGGPADSVVDGVTGVLVEPGNVEAHAQAFLDLARDPARRSAMGQKGWERVRDHFSLDRERECLYRSLDLAERDCQSLAKFRGRAQSQ